jgi:hypothetical protein
MDHDHWNDRTPATRCATAIKPVAVSLANAPPTATRSSVMGRRGPWLPLLGGHRDRAAAQLDLQLAGMRGAVPAFFSPGADDG